MKKQGLKSQSRKKTIHRAAIESYIQFVIEYTPEKEHAAIANAIKMVIAEINGVVTNWPPMRERVLAHASILDAMNKCPTFAEYGELFRWMTHDHFAFLGYCELEVGELSKKSGRRQSGLKNHRCWEP